MKRISLILVGLAIMALLIPTTLATPDLTVYSVSRSRNAANDYTVSYVLRNCGTSDLVDETFTDQCYLYEEGRYNPINQSIITHTDYDLEDDTFSGSFTYRFYPPSGTHAHSQWTDIYDDIDEIDEDNNYNWHLWYWY